MRASFICVGRLTLDYQAVWRHYAELIRPYLTLEVLEVPETALALGDDQVLAKEARSIVPLLRKGAFTVALDRGGQEHSSEDWSRFLAGKKLEGRSHFQFLVGGAAGLDGRLLTMADTVWSLSRLTFPHQMARCVALEQLYRSFRIERGEPYHH
jgi:23S rRNA (pseudouridine1915-N3)-methyltransferase